MTILSLDLGTTTITGVLWGGEPPAVLRVARRQNDAGIETGEPLRAEQDPRRLRELALEVLAELAAGDTPAQGGPLLGGPVMGLALTGQQHGLLCIDAGGEPLGPLITWQDRRTAGPLAGGDVPAMAHLQARVADLDWQANGCRIGHGYGAATLFWLAALGAVPAGTARVCTLAGWLAGQLTGRPPATDPTFAASWGILNLAQGRRNEAFLERLGIDAQLLPPVRPTAEPLGGLAPAMARRAGLPAGLPVFNPVGDAQAGYLAAERAVGHRHDAGEPAQMVLVNLGTGGQVCWAVPDLAPAGEAVETRPLPPGRPGGRGRFLRVGASLCSGAAYAWLNRTVRGWLAAFGLEADEEEVYERLNVLAAACPDTQGLEVRTTFLGVRGSPGIGAGAIEGISLENMTPGALARATLEGIVDELYSLYAGHGGPQAGAQQVVAAGGAVERNPLLIELIGERFRAPVRPAPWPEPAAVGAAVLAEAHL